jgi:YD repeat-containing protein
VPNRIGLISFAAVVSCLILGSHALAQGTTCLAQVGGLSAPSWVQGLPNCFWYPVGTVCPGPPNCYVEPQGWGCILNTFACPPAAAAQETQPRCPNCGSPISLGTGDTYIDQTDINVPGLGSGLRLTRTWNSVWPVTQNSAQVGLFGSNWRSTYEERVFMGSDGYMKYARSDGSFWSFGLASSNGSAIVYQTAAPANIPATLTEGTSNWTLKFSNGEQRLFDGTSGNLTAIVDRNGNTTTLSYDTVGRLTSVTDPASRHLYFSYGTNSAYLVTSVTSDLGVSVSYSYDNQQRLSQVTEPDQSTLSFQYDSNSFISTVLDSQGKVLEAHTYDSSGRGLTSSRANGVDLVSISYGSQ